MNIIINVTTLNKGGALQVAFSVIQELIKIKNNDKFLILCSKAFYDQIVTLQLPENFILKLIDPSPAKIRTRKKIKKELDHNVKEFNAQVVLTIFGPSYWKPKIKHICGFADGWCYYPNTIAFKQLSLSGSIKRKLLSWYKLRHLKSEANQFFIETEDAKINLANVAGIQKERIHTISNTYSSLYNNTESLNNLILPKNNKKTRFLVLSANYPHKNLSILNKVIPLLENKIDSFEFVTTIPQNEFKDVFDKNIQNRIFNIGPIEVRKCVQLYKEVNFLFLPTLLETFTATYPEAMKMKVPILTSDLSFAKDICGDAAIYFNPLDAQDITEKIHNIIKNPQKLKNLIREGEKRLKKFPSSVERASQLLDLCHKS